MENLEELLEQEKMNRFLDEIFEDIPKQYAEKIFFGIVPEAAEHAMAGNPLPVQYDFQDETGIFRGEQKEKIIECLKKVYSLGYSIGEYALKSVRLEKDKMNKKEVMKFVENIVQIVINSVGYFNPDEASKVAEETEDQIFNMIGYGIQPNDKKIIV